MTSLNRGVSAYVLDFYDIEIEPGKKGACPFCEGDSFQVKSDDSLGKCFKCDEYITRNKINNLNGESHFYRKFKDRVFEKCKEYNKHLLISKDSSNQSDAYRYLIERKIHPEVIESYMIGEVPPSQDLDSDFKDILEDMDEERTLLSSVNYKDRSKEQHGRLKQLEQEQTRISSVLSRSSLFKKLPGALVFVYTNENHSVTTIKLRKPYTKKIYPIRMEDQRGIFGHTSIDKNIGSAYPLIQKLLLVEGEFNQLQIQSECRRNNLPYQKCVAVGSVADPDFETIKSIERVLPASVRDLSSRPV
jgi:hypothetical protein